MLAETKIEQEVRERISSEWPSFHERRGQILSRVEVGAPIKERDVEEIFQSLAEGPLGDWSMETNREYWLNCSPKTRKPIGKGEEPKRVCGLRVIRGGGRTSPPSSTLWTPKAVTEDLVAQCREELRESALKNCPDAEDLPWDEFVQLFPESE